jgi:hypothetical protein
MDVNMNLTFPIADWIMGTSDLDRGVIGHLFNGYSMRHVKPEVRAKIERFINDERPGTGPPESVARAA